MIQKQGEITLFSGTYKGHELIIHEMIRDLVLKGDMLGKPYYCGYVEVLPEDYYYNCDLAVLFERYPTKGDQQLHDVRRCLALIDELEKAADRLPELPREKRNNNEN